MKNIRIILATCLLACLTISAFAQSVTPVKWAYKTVKVNDSVAELQFTANIEPNWHLYAQKPGQGQIEQPLVFNFTKSPKYERMGKVSEPTPQSEYDDLLDAHSNFYTKQVTFKQKVKVKDDQPFTVQGKLEGQACIEGRCTPIEEKFSFDLKDFHPAMTTVLAEDATEADSTEEQEVAESQTPQSTEIAPAADAPAEKEEESLLLYFLGAIVGGLAGLVMPCVFPMIPMTVSYFSKDGNAGKRNAMLYGLFIILIFVVIGLVLSLIFGADLGNILSTHWIPNILFAIIFFIFALSLLGYFEITLPSSWVNGSAKRQNAGSVAGIFFMALTLVLVSK